MDLYRNRLTGSLALFAALFAWLGFAVSFLAVATPATLCQAQELGDSESEELDEDTDEDEDDEGSGTKQSTLRFVVNPTKVVGHQKCVDCHPAEVASWLESKHAKVVFDELRTSENSYKYAKKLGIAPENISRNSTCITCHATPQASEDGRLRVIAGVSCEMCHNAAGGDEGWLNLHAVYGPTGTPRECETPQHYEMREFECLQRGQRRSSNVFQLAKSCFQCHIVSDEALVNVAGHKMGGSKEFDFVTWSLGDVRHNFHLNQQYNAEVSTLWASRLWRSSGNPGTTVERLRLMYLAGVLADLDVSLRHRSRATEEGDYADALNGRIEDASGELEGILDELDVELPAIQEAIDAVVDIIDENLTEIEPDDKALYVEAANKVEAAATRFVQTHDGSGLEGLDEYGIPTFEDAKDSE